ncbi:MAG: hypothetical protein HYV95_12315, partial [Opitutae bacterium]|nr:hypothetical protein [Opitutae bacterium]
VGPTKPVTVTGLSTANTNYTITQQTGLTAAITAKALTVSGLTASAKVYDGTTVATLGGTAVLQASETPGSGTTSDGKPYTGDTVTLDGTAAGTFADKDVGPTKPVTVTGLSTANTNYTITQQTGLTAAITAKALTVSGLTASAKVYDGTTNATLGGTAALSGLVAGDALTLGGTPAGVFADKHVGPSKAVTVTGNTISGTGTGNYTFTQQSGLTADITAKALTVTADNKTRAYGAADPVFTAAITGFAPGDNAGMVAGTPAFTTNATVSSPVGGTYYIRPALGSLSLANYTFSSFVDGALTITTASQTVTLTVGGKALQGVAAQLLGSASSGQPVSFSLLSGNATLSGDSIILNDANPVVVSALAAATTNYASGLATMTLTAGQTGANITLGSLLQTYDGAPKTVLVVTAPSGIGAAVTYNGSATAPTAAGSYPVVVTVTAAGYVGTATGTLVVEKANQTVSFGATGAIAAGTPVTLSASASSGLPVTFSLVNGNATLSGASLTVNDNNPVTVRAIQAGDTNYNSAYAEISLQAGKSVASVTLAGLAQTYNGSARSVTVTTVPASLPVNVTYNGSSTAPTNAGTYAVVAAVSDANYQGTASGNLVIAKAAPTISWTAPGTIAYGTALSATQLNATANVPGTFTYTPASGTVLPAGPNQILTANFTPSDTANYTAATASNTITVGAQSITFTITNTAQTFDGSAKPVTVQVSQPGVAYTVSYSSASYPANAAAPADAGAYTVSCAVNDPNGVYQGTGAATLTIAKATQTITLGSLPSLAVGVPTQLNAAASSGQTVSYTLVSGSATLVGDTLTVADTLPVVVRASQAGDSNYLAATQDLTLTAGKAAATISLGNLSQVYDGTPKQASLVLAPAGLSYTLTYTGISGTNYPTSATPPSAPGTYAVTVTVNDASYQGAVTQTLTIAKAYQSISFDPVSALAVGTPATLGATASSGLPVTFSLASGNATLSGNSLTLNDSSTVVVQATQAGDANFAAVSTNLTLSAGKAVAKITLGQLSQAYDGTVKSITASTTPAGRTVVITYAGSSSAPTAAGAYPISASVNDPSYVGSATGTLIVARSGQTVTFNAAPAFTVGTAQAFGATASSGLSVSLAVTSGNATYDGATGKLTLNDSAPVTVTANQAGDLNYVAASATVTLAAGKALGTVTLSNLDQAFDNTPRSVTVATNPASLPVTLTYQGSATPPTAAGSYTVLATINDTAYAGSATGTLRILTNVLNSADTSGDKALSLTEMMRVVAFYRATDGTSRTGAYQAQGGTVDGFAPNGAGGTLSSYHSADYNRNGKIELIELMRVAALYRYSNGTSRTGQYHNQNGTIDGFAPGP